MSGTSLYNFCRVRLVFGFIGIRKSDVRTCELRGATLRPTSLTVLRNVECSTHVMQLVGFRNQDPGRNEEGNALCLVRPKTFFCDCFTYNEISDFARTQTDGSGHPQHPRCAG